jgi:hypothetical protein
MHTYDVHRQRVHASAVDRGELAAYDPRGHDVTDDCRQRRSALVNQHRSPTGHHDCSHDFHAFFTSLPKNYSCKSHENNTGENNATHTVDVIEQSTNYSNFIHILLQ